MIKNQNELISRKNKELKISNNKNETLLGEIHHRIKNNLQLLISIIALQGLKSQNKDIVPPLEEISKKIRSIALIHDLLYTSQTFDEIDLDEYFTKLSDYYIKLTYKESELSCKINCNSIRLNMDTVIPLGIIFSELLNNSLKYAKSSKQCLLIKLFVEKKQENYFLHYSDNGTGYSEEFFKNQKSSMGMTLILSMVRQLKAKHSIFNESGAHFNLIFDKKISSTI